MIKFLKNHILLITFGIIGAIAGYLYYNYVGCLSGQCAITSKPVNSTLYGLILGGLLGSILKDYKTKKQ